MLVVGVLLAVVILAAAIGIVLGDDQASSSVHLLSYSTHLTPAQMFLAGVAAAGLFMLSIVLMTTGARRVARKRRIRAEEEEERSRSIETLEMEKRELQRELEKARSRPTAAAPASRPRQQSDPGGVKVAGSGGGGRRRQSSSGGTGSPDDSPFFAEV